ncbi:MAG: type II toxin-antitoxin system VapB family antitoxin [Sphingomonadales bacterium]
MAVNIKDPDTDRLVRELADLTGESITTAIKVAVEDRIRLERRRRGKASLSELMAIARRCAARPVLDPTPPDEMLYDEYGIPK